MGREFDVDALRQLTERRVEELIVILEEPFAAGIVTDVPGTKGRMRFSHVAFRQWLYEAIGLARRIHLHRRVAQVLEAHYETDLDAHLAELAHHFFEGAPGGDVDKAVDYARRAGDKAVALLAYEEAVRMQRMALQGLQLGASNKESKEQCDSLLALGDAQARGGDEAGSQKTASEDVETGTSGSAAVSRPILEL